VHTGLINSTQYFYRVCSYHNSGAYLSAGVTASATPNNAFNVNSAASTGNTTATVTFSAAPVTSEAQTSGNYKIVAGAGVCADASVLTVSGAVLAGSVVTLTTAAQTASTSYKVCVTGVTRNSDAAALATNNANFTGTGAASFLLQEQFNYGVTGQDLTVATTNWTVHSGGTTNPIQYNTTPLTMSGYCGGGGSGAITFTTTGQDVNRTYTAQTSGAMYFAALVNFTSIGNTTGDYFLHIGNGTTNFYSRVYAKNNGSGGVNFGIGRTTDAAQYAPGTYATGTTYLLVGKTDAYGTSGNSFLYVLTAAVGTEPGSPDATSLTSATNIANYSAIFIRQGTAANMPAGKIGCITVGKSWAEIFQ
jgi:hypothetical protein